VLETLGYRVDTVASGAAAYLRTIVRPPDLLVIDLDLGGDVLIRLFRYERPCARIIAVSKWGRVMDCAARALGADAFLAKPFGGDELERVISSVWAKVSMEPESAL
jgi:DNA-binding response OmpR family regulator